MGKKGVFGKEAIAVHSLQPDSLTLKDDITKVEAEYPFSRHIVVPRYSTGETGFYFQSRKDVTSLNGRWLYNKVKQVLMD